MIQPSASRTPRHRFPLRRIQSRPREKSSTTSLCVSNHPSNDPSPAEQISADRLHKPPAPCLLIQEQPIKLKTKVVALTKSTAGPTFTRSYPPFFFCSCSSLRPYQILGQTNFFQLPLCGIICRFFIRSSPSLQRFRH